MNKKYNISTKSLDKIAIVSSILCAFHCAILPIIIATSGWFGLQFLKNPVVEFIFIIVGIILFYTSILRNLKKQNPKTILIYGLTGACALILSKFSFFEKIEVWLTAIGAFFLVLAHYKNLKCSYNNKH